MDSKTTVLYSASKRFCDYIKETVGYGAVVRNRDIWSCVRSAAANRKLLRELLSCQFTILTEMENCQGNYWCSTKNTIVLDGQWYGLLTVPNTRF